MKVLIAYDGSDSAEAAIEDLARAGLGEQGEAIVLSAAKPWPVMSEEALPDALADGIERERVGAQGLARQAADRVAGELPGWQVKAEAEVESPAWAIVRRADEWHADLIVVGSHGRSALGRALLGSVSHTVLTHATCSVRIGRPRQAPASAPLRVVVGVDGSVESATAVSAMAMRRWPAGTEARVVAAMDVVGPPTTSLRKPGSAGGAPEPQAWISRAVNRVAQELGDAGLDVLPLVRRGDPRQVLLEECERWSADCLFVGAKGLSRLDRFLLGSVSLAVATNGRCSVEVVRQVS